ncbi:MAG TPA: kelch repeat-containing protein [Candidatus Sulfotelmatobacter sp.]|nr:kelch repeat-containing protein [Candidatus Sulfotelmatobacter sp.]
MVQTRAGHSAITLANRTVLLAGGETGDGSVISNTAEIYNPVTDSFSAVGPMSMTRELVQAVSLVK